MIDIAPNLATCTVVLDQFHEAIELITASCVHGNSVYRSVLQVLSQTMSNLTVQLHAYNTDLTVPCKAQMLTHFGTRLDEVPFLASSGSGAIFGE